MFAFRISSADDSPLASVTSMQVLRWFGYFKEAVPESPHENHRIRQIVICYYLSDDTLEVLEPRVLNSGIWQVQLLLTIKPSFRIRTVLREV